MSWMERGNCRNYPKDHMFLGDSDFRGPSSLSQGRINERLAICQTCPVLKQCHEWAVQVAMTTSSKWEGCIIGGALPSEINAEAARRYRPDCGTNAGYRWHLAHKETPCDPCRAANRTSRRKAAA